jgi:electron transfer flavoprotein alpha subunit
MGLVIHQEKIDSDMGRKLEVLCPFGAITYQDGKLDIGMGCKLCKLCVKNSSGAIEYQEEEIPMVDKRQWRGITVFVEHYKGLAHGVTFELLGKARELSKVTGHPVYALLIGSNVTELADELSAYGADRVYIYDNPALENFLIEPYANAFSDFINKVKPSSIMVGATNIGRSLAPRVAARFHTGLTADCTSLEMKQDTDLVQIRPAFGGNIMARIQTPRTRPQFCTVRYKVFSRPEKRNIPTDMVSMEVSPSMCLSRIRILDIERKPDDVDISEADTIIQVGRGVRKKNDLAGIEELANILHARMACTRPLVECGWFGPKQQIGLSGRTVKPKLLICIGVSGAIQTVAGMKGSNCIIAINSDPSAPIFDVAHYGFVGDLYHIIPLLLSRIKTKR